MRDFPTARAAIDESAPRPPPEGAPGFHFGVPRARGDIAELTGVLAGAALACDDAVGLAREGPASTGAGLPTA